MNNNGYKIVSLTPLSDSDWWVVYSEEDKLVRERAVSIIVYLKESTYKVVFLPQNTYGFSIPEDLEEFEQQGVYRLEDLVTNNLDGSVACVKDLPTLVSKEN